MLQCWVHCKLLVVCCVVELAVGFINIILFTKHDHSGPFICRPNNNIIADATCTGSFSFPGEGIISTAIVLYKDDVLVGLIIESNHRIIKSFSQ